MSRFKPTIVTVDNLISMISHYRKIVINGQSYISRGNTNGAKAPYYRNIVKRIIAAWYVVIGKGLVVQFSEDQYKRDDIKTLSFE